jgi:hypothetical protein
MVVAVIYPVAVDFCMNESSLVGPSFHPDFKSCISARFQVLD